MMNAGPIPTKTFRNYLQSQLPFSLRITPQMVCNVRIRVKLLQRKYGTNVQAVPTDELKSVVCQSSLENAPEYDYLDPVFSKVYKETMMDVLSGDVTEKDFAIVDVMNKIKECQQMGYNYRVYRTDDALGRPMGVMQMTMANIRRFIRDGNVIAIDVQDKSKNTYGWSGNYPSGYNGNNKLENYCDALTLKETDRWYAFLILSMC
jgi:hypothetical protein